MRRRSVFFDPSVLKVFAWPANWTVGGDGSSSSSLVDVMAAVKIRRLGRVLAVAGLLTGALWAQTSVNGTVASAMPPWTPIAMPASAPAETKFFPLSEVRRGMKGVAYTVFEGVNPEPMQVEILGLLKDALGPGQDMILGSAAWG